MNPVIWQLIRKDWYWFRWLVPGCTAASLGALAWLPFGAAAFDLGAILFVTAVIVLGVALVMVGVLQETSDNTLAFTLSLPVSPAEYTLSKLVANMSAFLAPWLLLTLAGYAVIVATPIANGQLPLAAMVMLALLVYYVVLLGVAMVTESLVCSVAVIVAGNVSVSVFMYLTANMPSVDATRFGAEAVWGAATLTVISLQLVVIASVLLLTFALRSRRTDFI